MCRWLNSLVVIRHVESDGRPALIINAALDLTISIRQVTLITEFDTLWLSPGIIKTAGSKLINGTLVDRGGSELQY